MSRQETLSVTPRGAPVSPEVNTTPLTDSSSIDAKKRQKLIEFINVQSLRYEDLNHKYQCLLYTSSVQSDNIGGLMEKLAKLQQAARTYICHVVAERRHNNLDSLTPEDRKLILALRASMGRSRKEAPDAK